MGAFCGSAAVIPVEQRRPASGPARSMATVPLWSILRVGSVAHTILLSALSDPKDIRCSSTLSMVRLTPVLVTFWTWVLLAGVLTPGLALSWLAVAVPIWRSLDSSLREPGAGAWQSFSRRGNPLALPWGRGLREWRKTLG